MESQTEQLLKGMQAHQSQLLDDYQTDLMAECETNENSLKDVDIEKQKLRKENKMKQKALEKASALIDLLTVELAITKKSLEETIEQLNEKLQVKQHQEFKLREQMNKLQQRNSFLEFECKKRLPQAKLSHSSSRTSFKSAGKAPSEQNFKTVIKRKKSDVNIMLSPPTQKRRTQEKELSLEYVKAFLQEYMSQDYQQNNLINNFVDRETSECQIVMGKLSENKPYLQSLNGLKAGISMEGEDAIMDKISSLRNVIFDQKHIIVSMRRVNEQYKSIINELINYKPNDHSSHGVIEIIRGMNEIFPTKSREIKDKIVLSTKNSRKKSANEVQVLAEKISHYQRFSNEIKSIFEVVSFTSSIEANEEDLLYRIKSLKANQTRLLQENKELISITDGLLKYIKY